jgi:hypothetical protein
MDPKIFSVRILDPDPNICHPGSCIKRGMKSKIYRYPFLCFLLYQEEVFKVKMRRILDPEKFIPDPDPVSWG